MNRKQEKAVHDELRAYAEEIKVRKGHLSNADKEKLLKKAKELMQKSGSSWSNSSVW